MGLTRGEEKGREEMGEGRRGKEEGGERGEDLGVVAVGGEVGRGGEEEVESGERVFLAANEVGQVCGSQDTWPSDGGGSRHEVSVSEEVEAERLDEVFCHCGKNPFEI
jgi:hypothetical protein